VSAHPQAIEQAAQALEGHVALVLRGVEQCSAQTLECLDTVNERNM
jgi:hypothetical protein